MAQINVQNTKITVLDIDNKDYICLTDMAGAKENDVRAASFLKWSNLTTLGRRPDCPHSC